MKDKLTEVYKDPKTGKIYLNGEIIYDPDEDNWSNEGGGNPKNGEEDE